MHLNVLRRLPAARLVAVAEPIEANGSAAAALAQGVLTFTDYQELIDEAELDAVVICLPPHLHATSAIAAFDAGLHVYLEKPLSPSSPKRGNR